MQVKKLSKSQLIIGFSFIFIGICIIIYKYYFDYKIVKIEQQEVKNFFNEDISYNEVILDNDKEMTKIISPYHYIAIIEIPKIDLKRGLVDKYSVYNDIKYNIQILDSSDMPDVDSGHLILLGHSGLGRIAFFNRLNELNIADEINIYYNSIKYIYKISKIYEVEKTGTILISRNNNMTSLSLITCKVNTNKQIVIISELIDKENF